MSGILTRDEELRSLLTSVKRIAVVGLSPKPHRDSNRVAAHMQAHGYTIVPVYPREETILGERVYKSVRDIEEPVDLVDIFRRSDELPLVVDEILEAKAATNAALWFQLDCVHEDAIARARAAGRSVIVDRCLMVDHRRLMK